MFKDTKAFSSFSTNDIQNAKEFYGTTLGVDAAIEEMGFLSLRLAGGVEVMIYPKDNHVPATFTVLNFRVANLDEAMQTLKARGVTFEHYPGLTDENGVSIEPPKIAWFQDPAGNILSVLEA